MPSKLDCALHAWCFRDDFHLKTFSLVTPVFSLGILKQWLNKDWFSHYINKSRWAASVSAGQATALLMGSKGQRWLGWIAQSGLGSYSISHSSIMMDSLVVCDAKVIHFLLILSVSWLWYVLWCIFRKGFIINIKVFAELN